MTHRAHQHQHPDTDTARTDGDARDPWAPWEPADGYAGDPWAPWAAAGGLQWISDEAEASYWRVADHGLARRVLSDPRFSRAAATTGDGAQLTAIPPAPDSIVSLDGAAHARLRRVIAAAFTARATATYDEWIVALVDQQLDDLVRRSPPIDLVAAFTSRLPLMVLCRLLGVPPAEETEFRSLAGVLFSLDDDHAEARRKGLRLAGYMRDLVERKRVAPDDDLLSSLISVSDDGDRLSSSELVTLCLSLLLAGYETTSDQLALLVLTLLHDRRRWRAVCADPDVARPAVEQALRYNPATPVTFARTATCDVDLDGTVIRDGEAVVVYTMGANRDRSATADSNLAFGHGPHRCVGAALARLQLERAVLGLSRRLPGLTLAEEPAALPWKPISATRGLTRLRVTW